MSGSAGQEGRSPVERGDSEEASGAPLTPTEEETSRRPAGTPAATPPANAEDSDDPNTAGGSRSRPEELNPDDFE
ncbi:hypothetical protein ACFFMN_35365 [Planobispora siamensis]|uniref:Uncharacterized protein n=1 Tax=Planobispora siamensis TaxID=936338 RepID=A0A8J3SM65_9ACTN|nr:hypothetical protein [Planobispora siamensis]GIH96986.1 hypothetical protein Psi01_76160 [Planobispora siamensis]